jgi:hypothetical protein
MERTKKRYVTWQASKIQKRKESKNVTGGIAIVSSRKENRIRASE